MAKNRLTSADGEGFLRAFWDAWHDLSNDAEVELRLIAWPTQRKGVFVHKLSAWPLTGGSRDFPIASVQLEYPTAQVQSYEAFLYTLCIKLERVTYERQAAARLKL